MARTSKKSVGIAGGPVSPNSLQAAPAVFSSLPVQLVTSQPQTPLTSGVPIVIEAKSTLPDFPVSNMFYTSYESGYAPWSWSFIAALCARYAYGSGDTELSGFMQAAFGASSYQRVEIGDTGHHYADVWTFPGGPRIVAFPGTLGFNQIVGYAIPYMVQANGTPTNLQWYAGIGAQIAPYVTWAPTYFSADVVNAVPALIFTGHSLGGSVAQYLAYLLNNAALTLNAGAVGPVAHVYTFGAPAFLGDPAGGASLIANLLAGWKPLAKYRHLRYYSPGDAIPNLTTNVVRAKCSVFGDNQLLGSPSVPLHYDTMAIPISPKLASKNVIVYNGINYSNEPIGSKRVIDGLKEMGKNTTTVDGAHAMTDYSNRIEICCRQTGDAPYPLFSNLVASARWMDSLGF